MLILVGKGSVTVILMALTLMGIKYASSYNRKRSALNENKSKEQIIYILKTEICITYCAFANAVERPTNLIDRSVCEDIYLILETIT